MVKWTPRRKTTFRSNKAARLRNDRKRQAQKNILSLNPFPKTRLVKLRYCQNITLNPATGTVAINYFYANGIYNPDKTGILDHQPLMYDNMALLYDHYKVVGSKINCKFFSSSATPTAGNGLVSVNVTDDVTASTDPNTFQEQPNQSFRAMGVSNGGASVVNVNKTFSMKKFFGKSQSDDLSAAVGASPAEGAYFAVAYMPVNSAEDLAVINVNVTIDYIVLFTERKQITGS